MWCRAQYDAELKQEVSEWIWHCHIVHFVICTEFCKQSSLMCTSDIRNYVREKSTFGQLLPSAFDKFCLF